MGEHLLCFAAQEHALNTFASVRGHHDQVAVVFFGAIQMKWLAWGLTVFAALSMVSDLKFYSGKDINLKESVPFVAILAIMMGIVLISYSPPEVLFTVVFVYALSGYYLWAKSRVKKPGSFKKF